MAVTRREHPPELVLKRSSARSGAATCSYVHLIDEVVDAATHRKCDLALLSSPPRDGPRRVDRASNLEKMPPKSTYFWARSFLSGLVLNPGSVGEDDP